MRYEDGLLSVGQGEVTGGAGGNGGVGGNGGHGGNSTGGGISLVAFTRTPSVRPTFTVDHGLFQGNRAVGGVGGEKGSGALLGGNGGFGAGGGSANGGGTAQFTNGQIVFTPTDPQDTGTYLVPFTICDDGAPPACADVATLTIHYNDPPDLQPATDSVAFEETVTASFASLFLGFGDFDGDDPLDTESPDDSVVSIAVSTAVDGTYGTSADFGAGNVCSVTGADTSDVTFTASSTTGGEFTCHIRVCEEMPAGHLGVCAFTTYTVTVRECLVHEDCLATERCQTDFTCVLVPNADDDTLSASATWRNASGGSQPSCASCARRRAGISAE